jgi:hypothetical protein
VEAALKDRLGRRGNRNGSTSSSSRPGLTPARLEGDNPVSPSSSAMARFRRRSSLALRFLRVAGRESSDKGGTQPVACGAGGVASSGGGEGTGVSGTTLRLGGASVSRRGMGGSGWTEGHPMSQDTINPLQVEAAGVGLPAPVGVGSRAVDRHLPVALRASACEGPEALTGQGTTSTRRGSRVKALLGAR